MKIAFFNCNARSIPPKKSGGIEKIINYLVQGCAKRGYQITVFGPADSIVPAGVELVSSIDSEIENRSISDKQKNKLNETSTKKLVEMLVARQHEFDIIHNHCLGAGIHLFSKIDPEVPLVSSIHEELTSEAIERLRPFKDRNIISLSYSQREPFLDLNFIANVYNGINVDTYPKAKKPKDYLVFVGRISQQKNPHLAILAAKKAGKKLYILGKFKDESLESDYFNNIFLPTLKENSDVAEWLDEVDEETTKQYFNNALASLHPATFRDPCPLSPLESMAAGCPAIAFNNGAYTELIDHGKTGFVVENLDEMVEAIKKIGQIDRKACRKHIQTKFSAERLVEEYIQIYESLLEKKNPKPSIKYLSSTIDTFIPTKLSH